jgi:hypothetical protein
MPVVDEAQQRVAEIHKTISDPKKDTQHRIQKMELAAEMPTVQQHADDMRILCKEQGEKLVRLSEEFLKVYSSPEFLDNATEYVDTQQTMIVGTCREYLQRLIEDMWAGVDQVLARRLEDKNEWINEYIDVRYVGDASNYYPASDATMEKKCMGYMRLDEEAMTDTTKRVLMAKSLEGE